MAKLALIDNVLLQQAVSTGTGYYEQKNMEVSLPIVPVLPPSYAGVISADDLTMAVSSAFRYYFRSSHVRTLTILAGTNTNILAMQS